MDYSNTPIGRLVGFCMNNRLVVFLATIALIVWGLASAPFAWDLDPLPRDPVPVDAIPDLGENQQIVFTEWKGRSPRDIEDQIAYPLTVSLLGLPEVKTIRSYSMFGFSTIYVIFNETAEFYWSRSRILEKLASLPPDTLPEGIQPMLGPDATALGQVYAYTIEGRDARGNPTGGWDLDEIRTVQDWTVRYALTGVEGVAEVASVGGFVKEYQIDVDPDAMRAHDATIGQIRDAVRRSNADVGARTLEANGVEYVIRGLGFVRSVSDLEQTVVRAEDGAPLRIADVAEVVMGPAIRRGALDKEGAEAVGGVVTARYGANPLETLQGVKKKVEEIAPSLPSKTLADGTVSRLEIVPYYDRSKLIGETLGTLESALTDEILITVAVVLLMVMNLSGAMIVAGLLPLAVLIAFIAMRRFGVDANVVALSGIAIAIGTMVDMGIVMIENILRRLREATGGESTGEIIRNASSEVGGAVATAVSTTVVGFLPVFTMVQAEGKLFKPLAYTKTFALVASAVVALTLLPALADWAFAKKGDRSARRSSVITALILIGGVLASFYTRGVGPLLLAIGGYRIAIALLGSEWGRRLKWAANLLVAAGALWMLAQHWAPIGPERGTFVNFLFTVALVGALMGAVFAMMRFYAPTLRLLLANKAAFLSLPILIALLGLTIWLGFDRTFGWAPEAIRRSGPAASMGRLFPGMGKEFMPNLDEGSFLYMPTTMPHASLSEVSDALSKLDRAIYAIPEVVSVVGKLGRADTALDPAPVSMIETLIEYRPEYRLDPTGKRALFRWDAETKDYARDERGRLIPDEDGRPYRQWRDDIRNRKDIWNEIVKAAKIPGLTGAPMLQPIETRIVMLQSGMRAPMGVKVKGPDLESLERAGLAIERALKTVPSVEAEAVIADRIVGKPYLEIDIDRIEIARHGLRIRDVQDVIETAIGGQRATTTVEGRERYVVRIRYQRELRDSIESLADILVPAPSGHTVTLGQLAEIRYARGPQVIKSEDTFLVGYVTFDKKPGVAEVDAVEEASARLEEMRRRGELKLDPGISYVFAGSYENQVRSQKTLMVVLPLALFLIFMILHFQFRSVGTSLMVFSGVLVAWSGGFIMLWLYAQPWFLDFSVGSLSVRELFGVQPYNLSVAVWVGFLALFGIASDDGVLMATLLDQRFEGAEIPDRQTVRELTVEAAQRRIRPALMTVATTLLALLPVLTSTGRGSDVMVPMAIPTFGGMTIALITVFVVPVLYCLRAEMRLDRKKGSPETEGDGFVAK